MENNQMMDVWRPHLGHPSLGESRCSERLVNIGEGGTVLRPASRAPGGLGMPDGIRAAEGACSQNLGSKFFPGRFLHEAVWREACLRAVVTGKAARVT